ncbi:MAG TPA: PDZ domain-containing protein, partial [Acetobacteraceae bacterium]|nr:PDZ domain-containing protein [Acetobacteraceae bacterium]
VLAGCASAPQQAPPLRTPEPAESAAQPAPATANPAAVEQSLQPPAVPTRAKATGTPEDARRHIVRGAAAIEMAKNADDLAEAADEFRKATEIAPDMAPAWYNLGAVLAKTGKVDEAIASYRRYLALASDAADAQKVADEIIKLEFHQERQAKEQASSGVWMESDGTPYSMQVVGNKWRLSTTVRPFQPDVEYRYGPGLGSIGMPISDMEQIAFNLELRNNKLAGTWQRAETQVDKCTVPAETGDVQGELDAANGTVTLQFTKARYKTLTAAPFVLSFETKDTCRDVSVLERRNVRFVFRGPLPAGGIGVYVTTAHGLMSSKDWIGELRVTGTVKGSPAELAGLYSADMLIAIDGVPVTTLSAGEAIFRLRGAPGSDVRLTIQRPKAKEPVTVTLRRQALPAVSGT